MCECCTPNRHPTRQSEAPLRPADQQSGGGCGCSGACGCDDIGQRSGEVHGVKHDQRERQPQLVALQITGA